MFQTISIMTPDGRRAWAFLAILGGCFVFTAFAAVGVWLLSGNPLYTLILALCAHLQLLVGMTALGVLLGRRMTLDVSKNGARLSDQVPSPPPAPAPKPAKDQGD